MHNGNSSALIEHLGTVWEELFPDYPLEYQYSSTLIEHLYESELEQIRILMVFCIISIIIAGMGLICTEWTFYADED